MTLVFKTFVFSHDLHKPNRCRPYTRTAHALVRGWKARMRSERAEVWSDSWKFQIWRKKDQLKIWKV